MLLGDFNPDQREYITSELYPLLKQSLLHFVHRSMDTDHYKTIMKTLHAKVLSKEEIAKSKDQSPERKPAGAFGGGFKMS